MAVPKVDHLVGRFIRLEPVSEAHVSALLENSCCSRKRSIPGPSHESI